ncbi:MAG: class II fumarate hydratase [Gammaproteobacteria bacterium]|uniref:class II fumarate hydratase n=1 Tax=Pseudomaricurvus alcaniphilus TaxID=1166482 RepID=UPI00140AD01F|nr:class II fumarate hydratase [Pseudomaricurvus alcaniphilus]MBR9912449.1 class II fumarate hydratase [Gammaproteobacteria bacterium]NHN37390.1 class II fumarate hydratase [Pseudomaricurvus alcaniphilus]
MNRDLTSKTRTERDSLGDVEVPADALYGAQTQRAIDNFPVSGLVMPRAFIRALGLIKQACAAVNVRQGQLDDTIGAAVQQAAARVASGEYDSQFPIDVFQTGSGTSTNMNANEVIAALARRDAGVAVHPNDHVNMSQSSNDVIPSCIHVSAALLVYEELLPALRHLHQVLEDKGQQLAATVKTGRTHLMDAMPVTMGQELGGWASQVALAIARLEQSSVRLTALAIGGTAVGTGINAQPQFGEGVAASLAQLTGIQFVVKDNYFEALSCQDTAVETSGQLKTLATALLKISNDLRWMNSGPLTGLAEIELPALQPGSSIMPGKVNPVIPEAVAMACAQVTGNDVTITLAGQSGNFQLNVMLPVIGYNLLQSIQIMASSARLLADKAIAGFTVNVERLAAALDRNPILVTALNREVGYEKGAAIAKQAYAQKRPVLEVALELTDLDEDTLKRLLDPRLLTGCN